MYTNVIVRTNTNRSIDLIWSQSHCRRRPAIFCYSVILYRKALDFWSPQTFLFFSYFILLPFIVGVHDDDVHFGDSSASPRPRSSSHCPSLHVFECRTEVKCHRYLQWKYYFIFFPPLFLAFANDAAAFDILLSVRLRLSNWRPQIIPIRIYAQQCCAHVFRYLIQLHDSTWRWFAL